METKMAESENEILHGQLTAKLAREISSYWQERGYYVLYDHDPSSENVGKIVSWFGQPPYGRNTQLSHIDIAIVEHNSESLERVHALIEIEETTDKPKVLLGDVFGILIGEHIGFGHELPLLVDEHSALFVFGFVFEKSKVSHEDRIKYIRDNVNIFRSNLRTGNSKIGTIEIKTFSTEEELKQMLTDGIVSATKK